MGKKIKMILFVLFSLFLIVSLSKNILDYQSKIQFYNSYKNDLEEAKRKNLALKGQIEKSKDIYSKETDIRNKLNLLKPDELTIIIPITLTPTPTPIPKKEIYRQWIELFIKL
jgi:hypothetical protein